MKKPFPPVKEAPKPKGKEKPVAPPFVKKGKAK
jgi:hypothetical protein